MLNVKKLTCVGTATGDLVSFTCPEDTCRVMIMGSSSVSMYLAADAASDSYPISAIVPQTISGRSLANQTLYFGASNGTTVHILYITGLNT